MNTECDRNSMAETILDQANGFADAYNAELTRLFERLCAGLDEQELIMADPEMLRAEMLNSLDPWYGQACQSLHGQSPDMWIENLPDEALIPVFRVFSSKIDETLPDRFKIRMNRSAAELLPELRSLALAHPFDHRYEDTAADEDGLIQKTALTLLGEWQDRDSLQAVRESIEQANAFDEFQADSLRRYFTAFGAESLPLLIGLLKNLLEGEERDTDSRFDYLLIYAVDITSRAPYEGFFPLLKDSFRRRRHKVIPAICLGDYGDRRAVTLLRSYLERNAMTVDQQLYAETMRSIKRLGGEVEDLRRLIGPRFQQRTALPD